MKPLYSHIPASGHACCVCPTDADEIIQTTVVVRRRPGHDPVPTFDEYATTYRKPLPAAEFAERYGAAQSDIDAVARHYAAMGMDVVDTHAARRHITLTGKACHINSAFNVTLHDWRKTHNGQDIYFRAPLAHEVPMVPDVLSPIMLSVIGINDEPPTFLPPAVPGDPPNTINLTPQQISALYNMPNVSAAGQTVGIIVFFNYGAYSLTDITQTCNNYSIPVPSITNIVVSPLTFKAGDGEANLDVSAVAMFGGGAKIVTYAGRSFEEVLGRMCFPNAGESQVTIASLSAAQNETNMNDFGSLVWEDCAIQGITVFAASGDWGTSPAGFTTVSNQTTACYPASHPYVCGVGGTTLGNVSVPITAASTFQEWMWSETANGVGHNAITGGGISRMFARPAYQAGITMPANVSTGDPPLYGVGNLGRGLPDIAAIASVYSFPIITFNGQNDQTGGTSASCPMMAGFFARINAALGHNVGFVNPALYKIGAGTNIIRDIAPTPGAPNTNANYNNGGAAGYPLAVGWDACTGLGVINGNNLVTYLKNNTVPGFAHTNYYIKVTASNLVGETTGITQGPVPVTPGV